MTSQKQLMKSFNRKVIVRKCVGCGSNRVVDDLIKLTKDYRTGRVCISPIGAVNGRSAYICKSEECLNLALKKNRLSKFLRVKLSDIELEKIGAVLPK